MEHNTRLTLSAGSASVLVACLLVGIKLWALGQTGALSIAASLADSAMDLMVSLMAMAALIYAAKPADEDHAFGHTSAEDLASLGQALFILVSALIIAGLAMRRLWFGLDGPLDPSPINAEGAGMVAMVLSILVTLALVLWQGRVARLTGNRVVAADRLCPPRAPPARPPRPASLLPTKPTRADVR